MDAEDIDFSTKEDGILVFSKLFDSVLEQSSEDEPLSFSYTEKDNKIFITQKNFYVRLSTANPKPSTKFVSLSLLIDKKYQPFCKAHTGSLISRLITSSMINKQRGEFAFKKTDKGAFLKIEAVSESGKSPIVSTMPISDLKNDIATRLGVQHLIDALRVIKDDEVVLEVATGSGSSMKISSNEDPNFSCYLMTLENPKDKSNESN
jgi:DNA polymerase III sliding clamp (beta) subunit (PCNA family)